MLLCGHESTTALLQALDGGKRWIQWHQQFLNQQGSHKKVPLCLIDHHLACLSLFHRLPSALSDDMCADTLLNHS